MSRTNNWQDHWLDLDCEGLPLREWCRNSTKKPGFAHCTVCNLTLKFLKIGVRALKDHGKSKKHLENCKSAADISVNSSSPSPTTDGKLKNLSYASNNKAVTCCDKDQKAGLSSDAQFQRTQAHQTIGTALGPIPYYQESNNGYRNALVPVYPCFFCPEEFLSKYLLHVHQASCIMKPPVLHAVIPTDSECAPRILEDEIPPSIGPRMNLSSYNISSGWSFNHHLLWPSQSEFIAGLGLLPKKKAQQVSQRRRNTECENIDWDEEIPITPTTPSSARTPKLLISHLSRDGHDNYRRRLSFIVDGKEDKEKDSMRGGGTHEIVDHEHTEEQEKKMTVCKSLYNLDVTSPLGQFVIKHFKGDPSLHILSDIESHCLTSSAPKNSSTSRLRVRNVTYPITFRGYSAKYGIHTHQYKFNKKDVREFMKAVNTGLNKKSRRLYRKLMPCKVSLKHVTKADLKYWIPSQNQLTVDLKPLSATEIAFWTMPKPTPTVDSLSVFPNGLKLTSPNVNSILGLRTRQVQTQSNKNLQVSSLTLSNFVSEEICAELVQNRKVLYRSLLSDCHSHSSNSVRFSTMENHCTTHSPPYSLLRQMLKQSPKACDIKSPEEKISKSSAVNVPVEDLHLCGSEFSRDGKPLIKANNSIVKNNFSDSLILQLTPVDIHGPNTCGNIKPHSISCKKRKLSHPASVDNDIKAVIQEKAKKILGGFYVKVRPSNEGDEIKTFLENQQQMTSFLSKFQDTESKSNSKKNVQKTYCRKRAYTQQVTINGFSSQRTLRSSLKVPLSKPRRVKLRDKNTCLHDSTGSQNQVKIPAGFNSSKKRNRLVSKSSMRKCLKKEIALQPTPRLQFSESHHLKAPSCPSFEDNMKFTDCKFQKLRPSKDSMTFKQKLDAAGLVKRLPAASTYNSHVPSRHMKSTVPISNEISRNSSTLSTNHVSDNILDKSVASGKHSHYPGLKKTRLQPSGCTLVQPRQHIDRCKYKNEKHKNFMLWLQNLRKGNIT